MRTIEKTVYAFSELSETAKQKAVQNLSDINVDYQWWEFTYEDAKSIGLEITSFELYRKCNGKLTDSAYCVASNIIGQHGEICQTYENAKNFISEWNALVIKHSDGVNTSKVSEENEEAFDIEADELEAEFLKSLLEDYSIILQKEYEHLTSEEVIIETIEANGYEFYENGTKF
jgi:hypothetical protein